MDIICYSHLRWNFVYQRPQHLMSRFVQQFRVFFIEEPVYDSENAFLESSTSDEGVSVIVPHLPGGLSDKAAEQATTALLKDLFTDSDITEYIFWYYTPMALAISASFHPLLVVYDCMDELSAFKFAPPELKERESELMKKADLVFTGGHSLYKSKKNQHAAIFPFPSSIDKKHFGKSRKGVFDPLDQYNIPHPRIGYYGVIDERIDLDLLSAIAERKPEWNLVLVGPVVKIDPATLPVASNIHYLGGKQYADLPDYLSGWDVAMMPFAINESTKFISPTKTPEYLAGGKPTVSTAIADVISPYGNLGLVYIAKNADEFIQKIEEALTMLDKDVWLKSVDQFLAHESWDHTAEKMVFHINTKLDVHQHHSQKQKKNV